MLTDRPPAKTEILREFRRSDQSGIIELPQDDRLIVLARSIDGAMNTEQRKAVRMACTEFLECIRLLRRQSVAGPRARSASTPSP